MFALSFGFYSNAAFVFTAIMFALFFSLWKHNMYCTHSCFILYNAPKSPKYEVLFYIAINTKNQALRWGDFAIPTYCLFMKDRERMIQLRCPFGSLTRLFRALWQSEKIHLHWCQNKQIQRLRELKPRLTQPLTTFMWTYVSFLSPQFLRRGTTVLNFDSDTNQAIPVFLKLESCHGTVTWCRPPWADLRHKNSGAAAGAAAGQASRSGRMRSEIQYRPDIKWLLMKFIFG